MLDETLPLLPRDCSSSRPETRSLGDKTPMATAQAKTIFPKIVADVVLSQPLTNAIDRHNGSITQFIENDTSGPRDSNVLSILNSQPSSENRLFLVGCMSLTFNQVERILNRLEFTVGHLRPSGTPIGFAGKEGQRFRVIYNKTLDSGQPGLQVSFTDPPTVTRNELAPVFQTNISVRLS